MPKPADQRQITIYVDRDDHRRLSAEARRRGLSLNRICLQQLQSLLARLAFEERQPDSAA